MKEQEQGGHLSNGIIGIDIHDKCIPNSIRITFDKVEKRIEK